MKSFLLLIGLLIGTLLFASENETDGSEQATPSAAQETVMKEKNPASDIRYRIETLGNELKESNCLAPRRVLQTGSATWQVRLPNSFTRLLESLRQRTLGACYKTSEEVSSGQTIHLSTLFCCKARHVFALRKLII